MWQLPTLVLAATALAASSFACWIGDRNAGEVHHPKFTYSQQGRDWASSSAICGFGVLQSPIDLPAGQFAKNHMSVIEFSGVPPATGHLFNRGFGLEWEPSEVISNMMPPITSSTYPLHLYLHQNMRPNHEVI